MNEKLISGKFWLNFVGGAILLAIIAAVVYPIFAPAKSFSGPSPYISKLKQLATAAIIYQADHDENLPFVNPFEFGIDPLAEYTKGLDLHRNYAIPKERSGYERGKTDFQFQFVVDRARFDSNGIVRTILDVQKLKRPESSVLIWTETRQPGSYYMAYADSHMRGLPRPYRFEPSFDPWSANLLSSRLVGPEEQWPPPTWSLPIEDVIRYAESQKR